MSPLVQRTRVNPSRQDPTDQHWSMLLFESLSGGVLALAIAITVVMAIVGIFAIFVWPLTFWDLASLGLEKYSEWGNTILWSLFAGGSLAGWWCFSGTAFKDRSRRSGKTAQPSQRRR